MTIKLTCYVFGYVLLLFSMALASKYNSVFASLPAFWGGGLVMYAQLVDGKP